MKLLFQVVRRGELSQKVGDANEKEYREVSVGGVLPSHSTEGVNTPFDRQVMFIQASPSQASCTFRPPLTESAEQRRPAALLDQACGSTESGRVLEAHTPTSSPTMDTVNGWCATSRPARERMDKKIRTASAKVAVRLVPSASRAGSERNARSALP